MIRFKLPVKGMLFINDTVEGERLETKIERVVHDNEPIKDGAPLVYTERSQGVEPQYNIRTDRFDIAIEATDKIAKSYKARRDNKGEVKEDKDGKEPKPKGDTSNDVGGDTKS